MKLVFVCPEMSGDGGTETVVKNVTKHFSKLYDVELILTSIPTNKQWLRSIDSKVFISLIKHDGKLNKLFHLLLTLSTLSNDAKVIVLGANLVKYIYYIRKVFRKKWQIISWIHYSLTNQNLFDPKNILFADEHWAISSNIKDQLIKFGVNESKIHLIFNPVSTYNGPLNKASRVGIKLVYVGRIIFDGQKNLKELLTAIAYINQTKAVHLDLYGTGPDIEICKYFAQKNHIANCLSWHGWVANPWENIIKFNHPQALILCSKYEGLPMVMLEAMSRGIACVCSKFNGYNDVLVEGENGFSYQLGDIQDLGHLVQKVRLNPRDPKIVQDSISKFYFSNYFEHLDKVVKNL